MTLPEPTLVFISHSTKTSAARSARRRLEDALTKAGLEPLVDERAIEPGDMWRRTVFNMVLDCHAAMIVLSADALASDWVVFETVALMLRRHIDPAFVAIPMLMSDVTREDIDASRLAPMNLNELEQVNAGGVNRAVARLAHVRESQAHSPLRGLQQQIEWWLPEKRGVIISAGARLGVAAAEFELSADPRPRLARALLDAGLSTAAAAFEILAPNMSEDDADRLLGLISCTWVDPEASAPIPAVLAAPTERRTVTLNSSKRFSADSYLQRAAGRFPSGWIMLETANQAGEDQEGALVADIRAAYRRLYPKRRDSDSEIDEELATESAAPYVVLIPRRIDAKVLSALRQRYAGVAFFVLIGRGPEGPALPGATALRPALDPSLEDEAFRSYRAAEKTIVASQVRR